MSAYWRNWVKLWRRTLFSAVEATRDLSAKAARRLWLWMSAGVLAWAVLDSILSVAVGFGLNVIPNLIYVTAFLVPVIRSGVLRARPGA